MKQGINCEKNKDKSCWMYITVKGKRGVSHADMIDLNRENIDEFDVREFYVGLVSELKEMGF